jgi:amino acid transporter
VLSTRHGIRSLGTLTVLKLLPLLAILIAGLAWLEPAAFAVPTAPPPGLVNFGTAALLVIYAFVAGSPRSCRRARRGILPATCRVR